MDPAEIEIFLQEITDSYRVPVDFAVEKLEQACNEVLARITGYDIETWVTRRESGTAIVIWAISGPWHDPVIRRLAPDKISTNAAKWISSRIRALIREYSVLDHFGSLLRLHHRVFNGQISKPPARGAPLIVDLTYTCAGNSVQTVTAVCPLRFQPPRERGSYALGQVHKFYVSKVRLAKKRRELGISIELSRTSRKFPETLMKDLCREVLDSRRVIRCVRRVLGYRTEVVVSDPLPKEVLLAVRQEIGEYLQVTFI
ncbi:MAG: hypothetical protein WCY54_04775 [Syntrophales bacterium]